MLRQIKPIQAKITSSKIKSFICLIKVPFKKIFKRSPRLSRSRVLRQAGGTGCKCSDKRPLPQDYSPHAGLSSCVCEVRNVGLKKAKEEVITWLTLRAGKFNVSDISRSMHVKFMQLKSLLL